MDAYNSFIHNTSKWYHTFDDSKIEILKKLSTFVALLCELKPEVVSADKPPRRALMIESFIEVYDIHRLLAHIYFNELKSYPSAIVSQEETGKRYEKDRNDFDKYIKTRKYEVNFISLVLKKISINKEYSLLGDDNIERWSRQIVDNYIVELKKYDKEHTFSRNNLYTISHVAVLDTYYWIDSFKDYIKESPYFMDWIARVASYKNNIFDWNELLRQQLNFPHWQNHEIWKQIITNSNYKETPVLTDLMEILNKGLKSLNKSTHPYLDFVESYWKNNDMYK